MFGPDLDHEPTEYLVRAFKGFGGDLAPTIQRASPDAADGFLARLGLSGPKVANLADEIQAIDALAADADKSEEDKKEADPRAFSKEMQPRIIAFSRLLKQSGGATGIDLAVAFVQGSRIATALRLRRQPASVTACSRARMVSADPLGDGSTRRAPCGRLRRDEGLSEYAPSMQRSRCANIASCACANCSADPSCQ